MGVTSVAPCRAAVYLQIPLAPNFSLRSSFICHSRETSPRPYRETVIYS